MHDIAIYHMIHAVRCRAHVMLSPNRFCSETMQNPLCVLSAVDTHDTLWKSQA